MCLALVAFGCSTAVGKSAPEQKTYQVSSAFNAIEVTGSYDVNCVADPSRAGQIIMHANFEFSPYTNVAVKNGKLLIECTKNSGGWGNKEVKATVYYTGDINTLVVTGSGEIEIPQLKGTVVSCTVTGSGDIDAKNVEAPTFHGTVTGSGDLDVASMIAKKVSLQVSGSGDADVEYLSGTTVDCAVSGSGEIKVKGSAQNASASVSGSGEIKLGSLRCQTVNATVTGSGKVEYNREASISASGRTQNIHAK